MTADTITAREGDTVDQAIWRDRGLGPDDLAAVFAINPGLAALGPLLPAGVTIAVPPVAEHAAPVLDLIQLWD